VQRTPYGKGGYFDRFVEAGYIVVSQDVRGRYESEGKWESFIRSKTHEAEDGYDTVEWAAKLHGSTGKVGTFGVSYLALTQWRLAPLRPPSLVAMSANHIAAQHTYYRRNGAMRPRELQVWMLRFAPEMRRRANRPGVHTSEEASILWYKGESEKWLNFLPRLELPEEVFEYETEIMKDYMENPHFDPWRLDESCKEISVPNLEFSGLYDMSNGNMLLYRTMAKQAKTEIARKGSRIIIGPWGHGSTRPQLNVFGSKAGLNGRAHQIRWFDYWLKNKQTGVDNDAPVRIFVMGDNKWRDEQHWPLQRTKDKVLYITSDGRANTPEGDGKLIDKEPASSDTDGYTYDPNDPVPTPYGRGLRPADQRQLANRKDILVYQTEPLTERIEVTGNPVVELYASSSAPDTDWFVRLIDVYPDGLALNVAQGTIRARYRNGLDKPELIKPGEIVKYTITMMPSSNAFLSGHCIRLDITSSDFPNYDRNHNTAANQNADATLVAAKQTIYHGGEHATRIILPWVPNSIEEGEQEAEKQTHPLHQAAADGDIDQVKLLIAEGADINAEDEEKKTPLWYAVDSDNMEVVQLLVEAGTDVNAGSWPPLCQAVDENNTAIAEYLIDHGADINVPSGWTPLQQAPLYSSIEMVELLIEAGADVNAGPRTALHSATRRARKDMTELLLQKGADVNAKDSRGRPILQEAADSGSVEIVELLIAKGADVNAEPWKILQSTFQRGHKDITELLLQKGADVNVKDSDGLTALHRVAVVGQQAIAELLLAKGAKVDERDDMYEFTALHYAARFGSKDVAEVLIVNGADIEAKDKWDYQPVHWAAHHDRADVVGLLLSKGAYINAKTSLGQTPLQLALERRNTKTVELLRKHGAKEESPDSPI
jgi:putative CocE/NonD family hydrolase